MIPKPTDRRPAPSLQSGHNSSRCPTGCLEMGTALNGRTSGGSKGQELPTPGSGSPRLAASLHFSMMTVITMPPVHDVIAPMQLMIATITGIRPGTPPTRAAGCLHVRRVAVSALAHYPAACIIGLHIVIGYSPLLCRLKRWSRRISSY